MGLFGIFHKNAFADQKKALHEVVDLDEEDKQILREDAEIKSLLGQIRGRIVEIERKGGKLNQSQREALDHIKGHIEKKDLDIARFHLKQAISNLEADLQKLAA